MEQYLGYSIDLISFHIILLAIEEDFSIYIVLLTVRMLEIGVSEYCRLTPYVECNLNFHTFVYQAQCRCLPGNCYSIRSSDPNVICPLLVFTR